MVVGVIVTLLLLAAALIIALLGVRPQSILLALADVLLALTCVMGYLSRVARPGARDVPHLLRQGSGEGSLVVPFVRGRILASSLTTLSVAGALVALHAATNLPGSRPDIGPIGLFGWVAPALLVIVSLYFGRSALRSSGIALSVGSLRVDAPHLHRSFGWEGIATVGLRRLPFGRWTLTIRLTDEARQAWMRAAHWYQHIISWGGRYLIVDTTALACHPEALVAAIDFYRAYPAMREEIGTGTDLERLRQAQMAAPQGG